MLQLVECPRDAMQGMEEFIPTEVKIEYLNALLRVGFHTIDFGSFVSPKAIPQLADTAKVLAGLNLSGVRSKLLAIVANARGAAEAAAHAEIDILGYPFSISEQFQLRNTNATLEESLIRVGDIKDIADSAGKELVLYLSMAFGNPYGELWHPDIAIHWARKLSDRFGVRTIALSDTIGSSDRESITGLFSALMPELPKVNFGAHLHTTPEAWRDKIDAAYRAGCRRFDGALKGYGGCPMAGNDLTGNMPTEMMISYFRETTETLSLNQEALEKAMKIANQIFP